MPLKYKVLETNSFIAFSDHYDFYSILIFGYTSTGGDFLALYTFSGLKVVYGRNVSLVVTSESTGRDLFHNVTFTLDATGVLYFLTQ